MLRGLPEKSLVALRGQVDIVASPTDTSSSSDSFSVTTTPSPDRRTGSSSVRWPSWMNSMNRSWSSTTNRYASWAGPLVDASSRVWLVRRWSSTQGLPDR